MSEPPHDLAEWGLHAYALAARSTPHHVVVMDSNGAILYAARRGTSREELTAAEIPWTDSQLALMRRFDLLDVRDERIAVTFPILGPDRLEPLRAATAAVATTLAHRIAADVDTICRRLQSEGLRASAYAVVFGAVLDGLVWEYLRERDAVPPTEPTLDHPYWRGVFWAIWPPRHGTAGLIEVNASAASLGMVWTDAALPALQALAADSTLPPAIDAVAVGMGLPAGTTPLVRAALTESGHPGVPVVGMEPVDPLLDPGRTGARVG